MSNDDTKSRGFFFGCYRNTSRWNNQKEGEESNSENGVKKN
jgi:hypothetical protein